jgi:hypothetical protein
MQILKDGEGAKLRFPAEFLADNLPPNLMSVLHEAAKVASAA